MMIVSKLCLSSDCILTREIQNLPLKTKPVSAGVMRFLYTYVGHRNQIYTVASPPAVTVLVFKRSRTVKLQSSCRSEALILGERLFSRVHNTTTAVQFWALVIFLASSRHQKRVARWNILIISLPIPPSPLTLEPKN